MHAPLLTPDDLEDQHSSVEVEFHELRYTVNNHSKTTRKPVLHGCTGTLPSRKVTAIFGPTGSGKTTLLDCLAGRKRSCWIDGQVLVNGVKQSVGFKRLSGYVVQDDILLGSMTVRENVMFSARLRLPGGVYGVKDRARLCDEVLAELKLDKCKDVLVGNELVRGVSGGERKRTNIACELVMRPSVLFLDEPTSGLDASTAVQVIECVRALAGKGCTVAMSIHQPRYSIFKLLDQMILLSEGMIVYQGPPHAVLKYFADVGFVCELNNNPADFIFDCLSGLVQQQSISNGGSGNPTINGAGGNNTFYDTSPGHFTNLDARAAHTILLRAYETSKSKQDTEARVMNIIARAASRSPESSKRMDIQRSAQYGVGSVGQFVVLCERYALSIRRMPIILIAQIVTMFVFAGIVGGIFWQVDNSFKGLQNRVGAMFFMTMSMQFSNLGALEILIKERAIFLHQKSAGYFSTGPYFLASVLCDLVPLRVVPMFLFGSIAYPMLGFQATWEHFLWFQITLISIAVASGALCYFISSVVGIFAIANLVVSVVYVIQMLFGGLLVNLDSLPGFLHFLKYLSIFEQGYSALAITELHGLSFKLAPLVHITGDQYLAEQGFDIGDRPKNLALLWGSALVYLILGYVALRRLKKE